MAKPEGQEEILDSVSSKMSEQDNRCRQLDEQSERLLGDVQKVWARLEEQEEKLAAISSKMSAQDDRSKQTQNIIQKVGENTEDLEALRQEVKLLASGRQPQQAKVGTDASRLVATEKEVKQLAAQVRALTNGYEANAEVRSDTKKAFRDEMRELEGQTCSETIRAIEQAIVELRTAQDETRGAPASPRITGLAAEVVKLKTMVEEARAEVKAAKDDGKLKDLAAEVKQLKRAAEATAELRQDLQEALQTEIRTVMERDNKRNDVIIEQLMEVTNKVVEEEHSIRIELTGRIEVLEASVAELSASHATSVAPGRRSRSRGGAARVTA